MNLLLTLKEKKSEITILPTQPLPRHVHFPSRLKDQKIPQQQRVKSGKTKLLHNSGNTKYEANLVPDNRHSPKHPLRDVQVGIICMPISNSEWISNKPFSP